MKLLNVQLEFPFFAGLLILLNLLTVSNPRLPFQVFQIQTFIALINVLIYPIVKSITSIIQFSAWQQLFD